MEGVLNDLEKLDANAREMDRNIKETENDKRKLHLLQKKLLTLRSKKKQLHIELANTSTKSSGPVDKPEDEKKRGKLKKLHQLQELYKVYRLCGVSIQETTSTTLLLRFDTFYNRNFVEEHSMELTRNDTDSGYSVSRHSLPPFIPVSQLEEFLKEDIKVFVMKVTEHLHAFVTRRNQIKFIESRLSERLVSNLEASLPIDYVRFSLSTADNIVVRVTLGYSDLTTVQPDQTQVLLMDSEDSVDILPDDNVLRKWEELLRTTPLIDALTTISGVAMDTSHFTSFATDADSGLI